ncbi:hypothetical protein Aperf_G00000000070 [Anoplocephala perfoliata]
MNCCIIGRQVFLVTSFRFNPRFLSSVQRLKPISKAKSIDRGPGIVDNVTEIPRSGSDLARSEIDALIRSLGRREDWQVIYHLRAMPFVQAFSKMKLLLTFSLVAGTPISLALYFANRVGSNLCWFVFGASLFSLATLSIFSYYSTKVIGVISQHKPTGLLRIGLLSFWGNRRNIIVFPEQFLPAADVSGRSVKRTVRVGLSGDAIETKYPSIRTFYITSVTGLVVDLSLFEKYVGKMWRAQ